MKSLNIGIFGYNNNFKKFLEHVKDKKTKYKLKFINKETNIKKIDFNKIVKKILSKKINIIALCDKTLIPLLSQNIDFFINKKIKIVQASKNFDVENHGFIIEKPFRDYSFDELFLRKTLKLNLSSKFAAIKNKKILITGGAGSIGSGLVKKLIKFNIKKLHVIDNNEYNIFRLKNSLDSKLSNKIEFKLVNIENQKLLNQNFKDIKPNVVFHAAALKHVIFLENNIQQGILTNIIGTKNVLEASNKNKVQNFIHVSTDKAAEPISVLGLTKLLSEYLCHNFKSKKMKIGVVRFGNVFNSYGSAAESFKSQILNSKKIRLSHPKVERYFMSVSEATNLILNSLKFISEKKNKNYSRTFICDMGNPIKIKDLVIKMLYLSGRSPKKNISKIYYGLNNTEKMSEKLISKKEKILKILDKKIFEINTVYKKLNFDKINNLTYNNQNNKNLRSKLEKLI